MKFLGVILLIASTAGFLGLVSAQRSAGYSRIAGQDYLDGCDESGCSFPGTECRENFTLSVKTGGMFTKFCQCLSKHVEYSLDFESRKRCYATSVVDPKTSDCEIAEDCQGYGKNAVCKMPSVDAPKGSCNCSVGYILKLNRGKSTCARFDCDDSSLNCQPQLPHSICTPKSALVNAGHCVCPEGRFLNASGTNCAEVDKIPCDVEAGPQCPSVTNGVMSCNDGRCACQTKTQDGRLVPSVLFARGDNQALLQCRAAAIGDKCQQNTECAANAQCIKASADQDGRCYCAPFYTIALMTSPVENKLTVTCEPAMGTSCIGASDCGLRPPATVKGLVCSRMTPGNIRGICTCPMGSSWHTGIRQCVTNF